MRDKPLFVYKNIYVLIVIWFIVLLEPMLNLFGGSVVFSEQLLKIAHTLFLMGATVVLLPHLNIIEINSDILEAEERNKTLTVLDEYTNKLNGLNKEIEEHKLEYRYEDFYRITERVCALKQAIEWYSEAEQDQKESIFNERITVVCDDLVYSILDINDNIKSDYIGKQSKKYTDMLENLRITNTHNY